MNTGPLATFPTTPFSDKDYDKVMGLSVSDLGQSGNKPSLVSMDALQRCSDIAPGMAYGHG